MSQDLFFNKLTAHIIVEGGSPTNLSPVIT